MAIAGVKRLNKVEFTIALAIAGVKGLKNVEFAIALAAAGDKGIKPTQQHTETEGEPMRSNNMKTRCNIAKKLLIIFLAARLLLLTGCGNNGELRHCVTVPKDALTSFSPKDEQRLLATFNIVVPEDETDVYVHSFSRRYSDFLGYAYEIYFTLELGGVKDYDAFYAANTGRIDENGLYGKAMNQFMDNGSDYYLAYQEFFVDIPEFLEEGDNQAIFDSFNELYESMA